MATSSPMWLRRWPDPWAWRAARTLAKRRACSKHTKCAMFEAIHGSAPRRAGQNLANPSGLLLGSVLMLVHINEPEAAERVHNAWLRTIEDGVHTYDVFTEGVSKLKAGTREFAAAVVERLGQKPN